jgi:hypothetical protein
LWTAAIKNQGTPMKLSEFLEPDAVQAARVVIRGRPHTRWRAWGIEDLQKVHTVVFL